MSFVQVCKFCGKFRTLYKRHTWSRWNDGVYMIENQVITIKKVSCQFCDRQRIMTRMAKQALINQKRK